MKKSETFKSNKKAFYHYYEKNDPQQAFLFLSKFDVCNDKEQLSKFYDKWKKSDRLKNILSIIAVIIVPLFFYALVKLLT